MTNPYTPGQAPRVLAGREREISLIRDRLGRVATFAEYGGPLLAFHAPRGIGKTSLLRAAVDDARANGFVAAWAAAASPSSLVAEIGDAVRRALAAHEPGSRTDAGKWRGRLKEVGLELGVPGAKVSATFSHHRSTAAAPAPIGALQQLLHQAARVVRDAGGSGLVLCLDEIHAASRDDLAVLLNALQNIDGERAENPLTVLAAGLPSTPEMLTRAATFGERSTYAPLHLLDLADSLTAVTEPATALKVTWDPDAARQVADDAGGYPYFLQLLAHAAWDAADPGPRARITTSHVRDGYPVAVEQLRSMYRARWKASTPREQDFLAAMAAHGTGEVPRAEIAERMGVTARALSVPRDRLIEKGIVEPAGRGMLRFTLPGFSYYVAAESGLTEAGEVPDYLALLTRDVRDD